MDLTKLSVDGSLDMFARHKMPVVEVKPLTKKNGQTQLTNLEAVAKALFRAPDVVLKGLQYQLKTTATYRAKTKQYLLAGQFSQAAVQAALQHYIDTWIKCVECSSVDTRWLKDEREVHCQACGQRWSPA